MLNAPQVLDRYFPQTRAELLEIAAAMDRYDRAARQDPDTPEGDERLERFYRALDVLADRHADGDRAERIQMIFSDPLE